MFGPNCSHLQTDGINPCNGSASASDWLIIVSALTGRRWMLALFFKRPGSAIYTVQKTKDLVENFLS